MPKFNRNAALLLFNLILSCSVFGQDTYPLTSEWSFKNTQKNEWKPATVPGVVHLDLLDNGLIDDPYYGNNEEKQRWIEFEDWEYKTTISADSNLLKNKHIELVFEGLDTYTTIILNGEEIATTDNMFRSWTIDVKPSLKIGRNVLKVVFHSPLKLNQSNVENSPYELPAANETVDLKVSPYTRKAAYHFGWDWGPRFVTAGIWRPVYLRTWDDIRIEDITSISHVQTDTLAVVDFTYEIYSNSDQLISYQLDLDTKKHKTQLKKGHNTIKQKVEINNPTIWNPKNYGDQNGYDLKLTIWKKNQEIVQKNHTLYIREIELINSPDAIGTSFYFKVNGQPIFAKGANYIPQDLFLPRVDSSKYEELIQQAVAANMNMIRVWGGGIYENDYFYDLCDQHGLLVWQDFMFANSMYPSDPGFISNIAAEIEDNVKRLRNHPCIAIWCGNNEIEVAWENWGWQKQYDYSKKDEKEIWNTYTSIFHELIPQTLEKLDPTRPYVSTSPLSNWGKPENFNHSSMHYWGVWHGREPIENFKENVGRFIAEYGYQSFPSYETLVKVLDSADLNLGSETMKKRQKSYIGNGIINDNIEKYIHEEPNFEKWVELSQLVQAHAYGYAIRQHRMLTPHCMGTLFWQLNDCWPGPSWSVIDYYGNEKRAYEEVSNYYKPIIASFEKDAENLIITLLSDHKEPMEVNYNITAESKKDGSIDLYKSETTLEFLKTEEIFLLIPKKTLRKCAKKNSDMFYRIEIQHENKLIFEANYYPNKNATVLFE